MCSAYFFLPPSDSVAGCVTSDDSTVKESCAIIRCGFEHCRGCLQCGGNNTTTCVLDECRYTPNEPLIFLITVLITTPIDMIIKYCFEWLHGPHKKLVEIAGKSHTTISTDPAAADLPTNHEHARPGSTDCDVETCSREREFVAAAEYTQASHRTIEPGGNEQTVTHLRDDVDGSSQISVAQALKVDASPAAISHFQEGVRRIMDALRLPGRRKASALILPHMLTLATGIVGLFFVTRVTRNFTSQQTEQWLWTVAGK